MLLVNLGMSLRGLFRGAFVHEVTSAETGI